MKKKKKKKRRNIILQWNICFWNRKLQMRFYFLTLYRRTAGNDTYTEETTLIILVFFG